MTGFVNEVELRRALLDSRSSSLNIILCPPLRLWDFLMDNWLRSLSSLKELLLQPLVLRTKTSVGLILVATRILSHRRLYLLLHHYVEALDSGTPYYSFYLSPMFKGFLEMQKLHSIPQKIRSMRRPFLRLLSLMNWVKMERPREQSWDIRLPNWEEARENTWETLALGLYLSQSSPLPTKSKKRAMEEEKLQKRFKLTEGRITCVFWRSVRPDPCGFAPYISKCCESIKVEPIMTSAMLLRNASKIFQSHKRRSWFIMT